MEQHTHQGWHSRGYLPHLDAANEIQSITFRLADALPKSLVNSWKDELATESVLKETQKKILQQRIAKFEDAGHGACLLREPLCATIVQGALLYFHPERYRLLEWCIMPNHVHVLLHFPLGTRLGKAVGSWKDFTCTRINEALDRKGQLWAKDYHDRYIRNEEHLYNARSYIRNNPVKAGLCAKPEDWPWSSAGYVS
jgi:putative transposase